MHILVIGPTTPHRGGVAHFTTMLINQLRARHTVTAWGFMPLYPTWLYPGNTAPDPSQHLLACRVDEWVHGYHPWSWWHAWRRLPRTIDAVVWQWWTPYWIPFLLLLLWQTRWRRIRSVVICHQLIEPDAATWQQALATWVLARADAVIFLGNADTTPLQWHTPHRTLPLPIHYDVASSGSSWSDARQQLNIPSPATVFLCFGFVRPYKGLEYVINAMALTPENAYLMIAGEWWPDAQALRRLIHDSPAAPRIIVHDRYIPNELVSVYFAAADVVLLPYTAGSVSGVSTLAAASGTPVICSAQGDIAGLAPVQAVVHDATPQAWAKALTAVCTARPLPKTTVVEPAPSWQALLDAIQEFCHVSAS